MSQLAGDAVVGHAGPLKQWDRNETGSQVSTSAGSLGSPLGSHVAAAGAAPDVAETLAVASQETNR